MYHLNHGKKTREPRPQSIVGSVTTAALKKWDTMKQKSGVRLKERSKPSIEHDVSVRIA